MKFLIAPGLRGVGGGVRCVKPWDKRNYISKGKKLYEELMSSYLYSN